MAFPGLKKPEERADVIAYLKQASAQSGGGPRAADLLVERLRVGRGTAAADAQRQHLQDADAAPAGSA